MFSTLKLHSSTPEIHRKFTFYAAGNLTLIPSPATLLRLPTRRFTVLSFQSAPNVAASSEPSISPEFISTVGSPSLHLSPSQWTLSQRHITVLSIAACTVAVSATWLFCSAIPALLAFKRAAESLEKLMDVAREELPGTMAAIRLSGMEISDLTMELSDMGQELTKGVRSSTRAVRVAEERLRSFTNLNATASMQGVTNTRTVTAEPALARSVRSVRERIIKGCSLLQMIFALARFLSWAVNYFPDRSKRRGLNQ